MKAFIALVLFSLPVFAGTQTYTVSGMTCNSCVKSVKAKVCQMEGIEKCDVTVGKVVLTPKTGFQLPKDQIEAAIAKAGDYKVTDMKEGK